MLNILELFASLMNCKILTEFGQWVGCCFFRILVFLVFYGFQEFGPNSDLKSSNAIGSIPRLSNFSTEGPTAERRGRVAGAGPNRAADAPASPRPPTSPIEFPEPWAKASRGAPVARGLKFGMWSTDLLCRTCEKYSVASVKRKSKRDTPEYQAAI